MKTIRILALILLFACVLSGCTTANSGKDTTQETTTQEPNGTTSGTDSVETDPEESTPDEDDKEPVPAITMKLTHVTISAGNTPGEQTALSELTEYLEKRSIPNLRPRGCWTTC